MDAGIRSTALDSSGFFGINNPHNCAGREKIKREPNGEHITTYRHHYSDPGMANAFMDRAYG